jgi:hypothetical protein
MQPSNEVPVVPATLTEEAEVPVVDSDFEALVSELSGLQPRAGTLGRIREIMSDTYAARRKMILANESSKVFEKFPRFFDTPGLVNHHYFTMTNIFEIFLYFRLTKMSRCWYRKLMIGSRLCSRKRNSCLCGVGFAK